MKEQKDIGSEELKEIENYRQFVETYEVSDKYRMEDKIMERVKQGLKVVSMVQTKTRKKIAYGQGQYIEQDAVMVLYQTYYGQVSERSF